MYRILIADDEVIERTVLHKKLKKYFGDICEVDQAGNGREVIAKYAEHPADVMILDIEMPGVSGLEAAEKIREQDRNCGIIFLTAFDEFSYAKRAISVQATDYLLKPCADKELIAAVEEAIRIHDIRETIGNRIPKESGENKEVPLQEGVSSDSSLTGQQMKIVEYIGKNYMKDLSVSEMALKMGYSEAYFCKLFKQYFGQSFVVYLTEYRVKEAIRLFEKETDQSASIRDIGQAVGYSDANYFAKVFKRVTGQSPTEYRSHCAK